MLQNHYQPFKDIPEEILTHILSYFPLGKQRIFFRRINKRFKANAENYGWKKVYGQSYREIVDTIMHLTYRLEKYYLVHEWEKGDILLHYIEDVVFSNKETSLSRLSMLLLKPYFHRLIFKKRDSFSKYPEGTTFLVAALQNNWAQKMHYYGISNLAIWSKEDVKIQLDRRQIKNYASIDLDSLILISLSDHCSFNEWVDQFLDKPDDFDQDIWQVLAFILLESRHKCWLERDLTETVIPFNQKQLQDIATQYKQRLTGMGNQHVKLTAMALKNFSAFGINFTPVQLNQIVENQLGALNFSEVKRLQELGATLQQSTLDSMAAAQLCKPRLDHVRTLMELGAKLHPWQLEGALTRVIVAAEHDMNGLTKLCYESAGASARNSR